MTASALEVFFAFLRLGLTSFGGPVAHLGYFHNEFIIKRKWMDEISYADLVALCQFLPGPASSQVGIALGLNRAGIAGATLAWIGFTLPSALILTAFAIGLSNLETGAGAGVLHALKLAAVPIVAQAIWSMGQKNCADTVRLSIALAGAILAFILQFAFGQIAVIALGGCAGRLFIKDSTPLPLAPIKTYLSQKFAIFCLVLFAILLVVLPIASEFLQLQSITIFASFFRAGSLVFGGGHVVLPLLRSEVVTRGWVSDEAFMVGYGAAQAIPGPLFAFSAYLGAISKIPPTGWIGAALCLLAAFLPSFLLVFATLPFWEKIRKLKKMRPTMQGINASVVGLLLSAFCSTVWTNAVFSVRDFALALLGFLLLMIWNVPNWALVLGAAMVGGLL